MQPYERFEAWKRAHQLALSVYRITERWPSAERFGLTAQARRAAFSIPANIVEGSARRGSAEFRRYLSISLGSLAELGYALRFARDLGVLSTTDWQEIEGERDRAGKVLWRLHVSLRTDARDS